MAPSRTVMVPSGLMEMLLSVGLELDRPAVAEHAVAGAGHELALGVDLQRAVAGVALAARGLHDQEGVAVDGDVERVAGRRVGPVLKLCQVARSCT